SCRLQTCRHSIPRRSILVCVCSKAQTSPKAAAQPSHSKFSARRLLTLKRFAESSTPQSCRVFSSAIITFSQRPTNSRASLAPVRSEVRSESSWPEVVERLAYEDERLARRPQRHNGEYFVVCTLYYTPMESGFTSERGFDATPITKP